MQLFEDIGVSSTLNKSVTSLGLGSNREKQRVCEESRKMITCGFKNPEEVREAEKKVEVTSKNLSSKSSQTRKSAEAEREMLKEKVRLYEETILPAYKASAAQSSLALTQTFDDLVEDKKV